MIRFDISFFPAKKISCYFVFASSISLPIVLKFPCKASAYFKSDVFQSESYKFFKENRAHQKVY